MASSQHLFKFSISKLSIQFLYVLLRSVTFYHMFCISLYVLSRSNSVPSRSATCSAKRYALLIRSVTFQSSSFTFFHIFRQIIQHVYTFRHVLCNSYTETWKHGFERFGNQIWSDWSPDSGWVPPSWGRGQLDFSHLLPTAQWCKVWGRENTSSCHWRWWGQTTVIWAHPSRAIHFITFWSRSGYVLSRSKHGVHFWISGHAFSYNCIRSHAFRATLLINMEAWHRIPLNMSLLRLRSNAFYRMIWPSPHIIVYVLMRSGQPYW